MAAAKRKEQDGQAADKLTARVDAVQKLPEADLSSYVKRMANSEIGRWRDVYAPLPLVSDEPENFEPRQFAAASDGWD